MAAEAVGPLSQLDAAKLSKQEAEFLPVKEYVAFIAAHTRAVSSLAFARGDRFLASSGWDNKVQIWEFGAATAKRLATLPGSPSGVAFAPNGTTLATGGAGTHVHLWDLAGGKPKETAKLAGHQNRPFALAFDLKGKLLASGCSEPVLRLWKLGGAEPEQWAVLPNESAPAFGLNAISFSSDGRYLAAGHHFGEKTLRVWRVNGPFMEEVELPMARAKVVAFSPKGPILAYAGADAGVRLLSLEQKPPRPLKALEGHDHRHGDAVRAMAFAPDGRRLATAGKDRKVILWDVSARKKLREWTIPEEPRALAFAHDDRHLAIGSEDGSIYLLRLRVDQK